MVKRYTRKEMGELWAEDARFKNMLDVEIAVAQAQAELGLIPENAAQEITEKGSFQVPRILEIERETRHDVIAFVSNVAENVGESGRYVHYGLTSSDVLDTALSVQIREASIVLMKSLDKLITSLKGIMERERDTLCAGRTHGMHAEPTTFGYKMAGHFAEFRRHRVRLERAIKNVSIGKLSGAVGAYSFLKPDVEAKVCEKLGLQQETVATQVIPRDRHAELMTVFALVGGGIERLATEIRHLQRTEMGEAFEGFAKGQKGSSAMPHKKNPIGSENLTGCARLLRSYALSALENMALWHERDISHSSVERVIFPDSFILCDYALDRMAGIIDQLQVMPERMKLNMDLSQGQLFSSHLLLHIVDQGVSREEAYKIIQSASHGLQVGDSLKAALLENGDSKKYFSRNVLDEIFSGQRHLETVRLRMDEILKGQL